MLKSAPQLKVHDPSENILKVPKERDVKDEETDEEKLGLGSISRM